MRRLIAVPSARINTNSPFSLNAAEATAFGSDAEALKPGDHLRYGQRVLFTRFFLQDLHEV